MYIKINNSGFKLVKTNSTLEPINLNIKNPKYPKTLFETIKIKDGKIANLEYHQKRVDFTFRNLFKTDTKIQLSKEIKEYPLNGLYRAKVIYDINGLVEYNIYSYTKKPIKSLALVELKDIEYNFKYTNREIFENIYTTLPEFDEFIITKNGYLSDTTIANIALLHTKTNKWHTPTNSLLSGTTRERYLKCNKLIKKMIHYRDLKNYSKIATLNAMVDFNILKAK